MRMQKLSVARDKLCSNCLRKETSHKSLKRRSVKPLGYGSSEGALPVGFGDVSMVYNSFIVCMSYRYIWSSRTITNLFLFSRTARTVVGKVSSHIMESLCSGQQSLGKPWCTCPTFVFLIWSLLGESMRATKEVENSISSIAMLPASLDSKHFAKGSVVKIRNPLEVPCSVSYQARK